MCIYCEDIETRDITELNFVRNLLRDGLEAFRLTREYVGEETLPEIEGWSHYDWTQRVRDYFGE